MEPPYCSSDGLISPSNSPVTYGGVSTNTIPGSHGEEEKPADGEGDVTVLPHEASPTRVYLKRCVYIKMIYHSISSKAHNEPSLKRLFHVCIILGTHLLA